MEAIEKTCSKDRGEKMSNHEENEMEHTGCPKCEGCIECGDCICEVKDEN